MTIDRFIASPLPFGAQPEPRCERNERDMLLPVAGSSWTLLARDGCGDDLPLTERRLGGQCHPETAGRLAQIHHRALVTSHAGQEVLELRAKHVVPLEGVE